MSRSPRTQLHTCNMQCHLIEGSWRSKRREITLKKKKKREKVVRSSVQPLFLCIVLKVMSHRNNKAFNHMISYSYNHKNEPSWTKLSKCSLDLFFLSFKNARFGHQVSSFLMQNSRSCVPAHPKTSPIFVCVHTVYWGTQQNWCARVGARHPRPLAPSLLFFEVWPSVCKHGFTAPWALYNAGIAPWCHPGTLSEHSQHNHILSSAPLLPCLCLSPYLQGYRSGWISLHRRAVCFSC